MDGRWDAIGLTAAVNSEDHLNIIRKVLHEEYLPNVRISYKILAYFLKHLICQMSIHELYMVDINAVLQDFLEVLKESLKISKPQKFNESVPPLKIIEDQKYRRFKSTIDLNIALKIVCNEVDFCDNEEEWIEWSIDNIRHKLTILNDNVKNEINIHLSDAVENVIKTVRYERIDSWGPKYKAVAKTRPLVWNYFTHKGPDLDLLDEEKLAFDDNTSQYLMAHNGWVMGDDPLRNFAEKGLIQ